MTAASGTANAVSADRFVDRRDAGRRLALQMAALSTADPVIVALPRGGVPVGAEIARSLGAPLEVFGVRKLGAPANPEYGVGAIAEDGTRVVDPEAAALLGITNGDLDATAARERGEIERQLSVYRGDRPPPDLHRRTVVIVDDGAATGLTDAAAIHAIRRQEPKWTVIALPVCSPPALDLLAGGRSGLLPAGAAGLPGGQRVLSRLQSGLRPRGDRCSSTSRGPSASRRMRSPVRRATTTMRAGPAAVRTTPWC